MQFQSNYGILDEPIIRVVVEGLSYHTNGLGVMASNTVGDNVRRVVARRQVCCSPGLQDGSESSKKAGQCGSGAGRVATGLLGLGFGTALDLVASI